MDTHIETEKKKDKGFTLVELLIVIVILGILATVTVFAVRGITDKGQENSCTADQKTLQVAMESFYAQKGTTAIPTEANLKSEGFIRDVSKYLTIDPANGNVIVDTGVTDNPCAGKITAG